MNLPQQATQLVFEHPQELLASDATRPAMWDPATVARAMNYLYWFGYLAYQVAQHVRVEDVQAALRKFQDWFRLKAPAEDGKLGPKTAKAMTFPRCGCPDVLDRSNGRHQRFLRMKAFTAGARPRWQKHGLGYYIQNLLPETQIPHGVQELVIAQAWRQWTGVSDIAVDRVANPVTADLIIDVGRGSSCDFDGPAGTLAWAYMPDGRDQQLLMRFDLDELWTTDRRDNGVCLLNVACHEFGHMLGLDHSRCPRALMAPFYNESVDCPQPVDDIERVQALYGPRRQPLRETPRLHLEICGGADALVIPGYKLVPDPDSGLPADP